MSTRPWIWVSGCFETDEDISVQCSRRNVDGFSILSTLWQGCLVDRCSPIDGAGCNIQLWIIGHYQEGREGVHGWVETKGLCSEQVKINSLFAEQGQTVQNCAEILHIPDLFVRWSFCGTDYFKYFIPETMEYFWVEREEEHHECEGGGGLWG